MGRCVRGSDALKQHSPSPSQRAAPSRRQKPHVVEIGSFSLIPDGNYGKSTRGFGVDARGQHTEYIPRAPNRGRDSQWASEHEPPIEVPVKGNGQSQEPSKGKDNESPSHLTAVGQPELAQIVGGQVGGRAAVERQTANARIDQMNAQIITM